MITTSTPSNILDELRQAEPTKTTEAAHFDFVAEQAAKLLDAVGIDDAPVSMAMLKRIPGVVIELSTHMPVHADRVTVKDGVFYLAVDATQDGISQRFEIAHLLQHVLIYTGEPNIDWRCMGDEGRQIGDFDELLAEHFAWSLLLPEAWIRFTHDDGERELHELADRFGVDLDRMAFRLAVLGLPFHEDYRQT